MEGPVMRPKYLLGLLVLFALSLQPLEASQSSAPASDADTRRAFESNRRYAFELYDQGKVVESLPLLEDLASAKPDDAEIVARLGVTLVMYAATLKDPETATRTRKRGRELCAKAKQLGSDDYMVRYLLETMAEDGSRGKFSDNETIEQALKEGEAAWVKGDLESAKAAYLRAHLLDPANYEAALFIGDVYFREQQWGSACEWFSQATKINPDRETAYRYWADALFMMRKTKAAREKYIEAFITEPFTTSTRSALARFGERMQLTLAHPKIESPNSLKSDPSKPNSINITIDSGSLQAKDGTNNWMLYEVSRAAWRTDEVRKRRLPNEKEYRHSMMEEVDALNMVAAQVESQLKAKKIKQLDPSLQVLLRLKNEGLLEAYVLLARADEGIAQDYAAYFRDNREKLRRYMSQYVVPEVSDTAY